MRVVLTISICVLLVAGLPSAQIARDRFPRFVDYRVSTRFRGVPAEPRFTPPPSGEPIGQAPVTISCPTQIPGTGNQSLSMLSKDPILLAAI